MKGDFDFIQGVMNDFLARKSIRQRLKYFAEIKSNDWERWLQVELEYFFEAHESVSECYRECSYYKDMRKNDAKGKQTALVDMALRKKYSKSDYYNLIEFKVNSYRDYCLNAMLEDVKKIRAIKKSESDARAVFYIGFFYDRNRHRNQDHHEWLCQYLEKRDTDVEIKHIGPIGRTCVNMVVLE